MPSLRERLHQLRGRKGRIEDDLSAALKEAEQAKADLIVVEEASILIRQVAQATQQELEYHVAELVSLALASIFPDPYELKVAFDIARGKSQATLSFTRTRPGEVILIDPMSASGGGAVDVTSFALRLSLWSMMNPRTSPCFLFDEPLRFLSRGLQPRASGMVKDIAARLGVQFVLITHEDDLLGEVDRVVEIGMSRGVSRVLAEPPETPRDRG